MHRHNDPHANQILTGLRLNSANMILLRIPSRQGNSDLCIQLEFPYAKNGQFPYSPDDMYKMIQENFAVQECFLSALESFFLCSFRYLHILSTAYDLHIYQVMTAHSNFHNNVYMHSLFPCNLRLSHTVCLQFHFSPAHYASVKMHLESHHLDVEQLQEDSFLQPHKFLQNFEIFSIIGTIDYIFFYYIMKKAKSNK